MAIIKTEEEKTELFNVGEMQKDYDGPCCTEEPSNTKMKKSYPTMYLYEIPDELFNSFKTGDKIEVIIKGKVRETSERTTDREDEGEKTRRTVDLEIHEVSKPIT